jgi:hypothetical protein
METLSLHRVARRTALLFPWFATTKRNGLLLIILFAPLTALVLFFDSQLVRAHVPTMFGISQGQMISNSMAPIYLLLLLPALQRQQRLMALVFLPIAIVGELVFSLVFELYTYAEGSVPVYVPFGHAILFGTGLLICDRAWVVAHTALVRWGLLAFHAALIAGAIFGLGDTLTALFTLPLLYILYRSRLRVFYLVMGVLVLYVELVGTWLGCWQWDPAPIHGLLHAVNPPVGAFCCYVVADILTVRGTQRLLRWWQRRLG